jgi:AraC-like DNA-binding protein
MDGRVLGGLDFEVLLNRSRIDPAAETLTADQHFLMMLNSIDITGDESHGLADRPLRPGYAVIALRAMLGAPSLGAALRVLGRYFALSASVFELDVREAQGLACIALSAKGRDRVRAAMLEEIWLMTLNMFLSWFVGRRLPVLAMSLSSPDHPDLGGRHWAVGAPVSLRDSTSILIPSACLSLPKRASEADEPIWEAMSFWMKLTSPPQGGGPLGQVFTQSDAPAKARLRDALDVALCDRQVARRVRGAHGASFRELRAEALTELARDLLVRTEEPIEAIGAQLGYAEESSFRRFMRSRTGFTPSQIRSAGPAPIDPEARALLRTLVRKLEV